MTDTSFTIVFRVDGNNVVRKNCAKVLRIARRIVKTAKPVTVVTPNHNEGR